MVIGAHVSTAGGLENAIKNGQEIGAEAIQIFPSAPLQWRIRGWSDEDCQTFKKKWPTQFENIVFHGIYLTNLSGNPENLEKTKNALIDTLILAPKIGVVGTIFHPGTYQDGGINTKDQIKKTVNEVLAKTPPETKLVFENSAGSTIGGKLEDLAWLVSIASDKQRVGVCLDTCHAFAAGYDLSNKKTYENFVAEVDQTIGLTNIFAWHLNDSKFELGAKRDRHENIGSGKLGQTAFELLINDSRWQKTAGYLEVPGFEGGGPDKRNVDLLKSLRHA